MNRAWHARPLPLLLGLVAYLLFVPAVAHGDRLPALGLVTIALFALGTLAVARHPRRRRASIVMLVLTSAARVTFWFAPSRPCLVLMQVTGIAFLLLTTLSLMRVTLGRTERIDERIEAALATYLLLGFVWAVAYSFVSLESPGSFRFPEAVATFGDPVSESKLEHQFLYFSFVTLTTVGYGDVTPVLPIARSLAVLEAVTGQLFLAVTIAKLVGARPADGAS